MNRIDTAACGDGICTCCFKLVTVEADRDYWRKKCDDDYAAQEKEYESVEQDVLRIAAERNQLADDLQAANAYISRVMLFVMQHGLGDEWREKAIEYRAKDAAEAARENRTAVPPSGGERGRPSPSQATPERDGSGHQDGPAKASHDWPDYRCPICGHAGSPCPQHDGSEDTDGS